MPHLLNIFTKLKILYVFSTVAYSIPFSLMSLFLFSRHQTNPSVKYVIFHIASNVFPANVSRVAPESLPSTITYSRSWCRSLPRIKYRAGFLKVLSDRSCPKKPNKLTKIGKKDKACLFIYGLFEGLRLWGNTAIIFLFQSLVAGPAGC